MLKPDHWIREKAIRERMIEPFVESKVRGGVISYGPSSYGYDTRLADEFQILDVSAGGALVIDPKNLDGTAFTKHRGESVLVPARSYILARSFEYFRIPHNVTALVQGKSTYARCGLYVNVTPLEAGWEGFITICLANLSPAPIRLYAGEGIAQVLFFESESCQKSYADTGGTYQGQKAITLPKV